MANQLTKLLKQYYPSSLTKKVELTEEFLKEAQKWSREVLDFSFYRDLEYLEIKNPGSIGKIKIKNNKQLQELIIPNQELTGVLDLSANSKLEKINIANNSLNELKVHGDFWEKLKGIEKKYLTQKHNKDKIHPIKDATIILLDISSEDEESEEEEDSLEKENAGKKNLDEWLLAGTINEEKYNLLISEVENKLYDFPEIQELLLSLEWKNIHFDFKDNPQNRPGFYLRNCPRVNK